MDRMAGALLDAQVDLNPHQIEAALFATRNPLSKGATLADEVGLGKTIEAGLLSLWSLLNRVQENLLRGGLTRHAPSGRLTRMRRITSIREDVRLNGGLWDLAAGLLDRELVC